MAVTTTTNQDSSQSVPPENAAAAAAETETGHEVDLTPLDTTWIQDRMLMDDDYNNDNSNTSPPSYEAMLRRRQRTQLQTLTCSEAFHERLQTFRPVTYFCKPASLSPLVCARFGWINTSIDMLKCVCCKAALVVQIHPKITKRSTITKLIRAYQTKLATAHKETCPFRFEAEVYLVPNSTTNNKDNNNDNDSIVGNDDDAISDNSQQAPPPPRAQMENVVPPHFVSILPRDVWQMMEQPDPQPFVLARFQMLEELFVPNRGEKDDGWPPKWLFPKWTLPQEVLQFGDVPQDNHHNNKNNKNKSLHNRMLAKLAFNRKEPMSALGVEHETLLTRLEDVLHPPTTPDEEIRAQTRTQGAWESLYEGMAALTLFGWMPPKKKNTAVGGATKEKEEASVSLQCSICLSNLNFQMQEYDVHHHYHHHHTREAARDADVEDEEGSNRSKKRKLHNDISAVNPLMAHRFHCPYVCGFPMDGERKGTPIWATVASKLFSHKHDETSNNDDDLDMSAEGSNDDAAMDRILQLLQAGVSSHRRGVKRNKSSVF